MSRSRFGRLPRLGGALIAFLVVGQLGAQSSTGIIAVKVTSASATPIEAVQVQVIGTNLGGITGRDGVANIRGVAPGSYTVRVIRVGYTEQKKPVTVVAGQTANLEFSMADAAVTLTPVVTTATGVQRRIEIGNATANVDVADVTRVAPVGSLSDVLNSRAPGVTVQSGTQTGTGARIRVRGVNSISLDNEPIWIIDGVRMTSNNGSFATSTGNGASGNTGGNNASRTGDLNPEEIESIEVVKGPSAATLYGTDAANGVIVVTTKRGRAGAPQWNVYGEGGLITDRNTYPTAYTLFGQRTSGAATTATFCNNQRVATGVCTIDSVGTLNIFEESDLTPLGTGNRTQAGAQVSGGTEAIRYFVSGEREDETGVLELPEFEKERFARDGIPLNPWTERPNVLGRNSVRANLNSSLNPQLDIGIATNFINLRQRYSLESNATAGLGSHVFGGPGYRDNGDVAVTGLAGPAPRNGYRSWTPGFMWQEKTEQAVKRFIWSGNANYRPTSWLQNRFTVGQDYTSRADDNLLLRGEGPPLSATTRLGSAGVNSVRIQNLTGDWGSTATFNPTGSINLKTTVGAQYINYSFLSAQTGGRQLAPGSQTVGSAAQPSVSQATTASKTFGLYVEQAVALNDRLFLTGAVRTDQNSAFGTDFQRVFYPKVSASWLISEEGFWKAPGFMNTMRLRAAYGQSGVQPGANAADLYFTSNTSAALVGNTVADQPTLTFASLGNPDLKPERSGEFEGGFESQLFNNRLTVDVTYYNKRTEDALINEIVPPSYGVVSRQLANLGAVQNKGWEMQVSGQALDKSWLSWDLNLAGSLNSNKVLDLGGTDAQVGTTTRIVEGYPISGLWARPITGWEDKDGDGLLEYNANDALNEVFVGDSAIFRGYAAPRYQATLISGWGLLSGRLRLQTMFDYRGGNRYYNNTERIRCQRPNCQGINDPEAPFVLQAANIAARENPAATLDGYFQPGAFVRLREASAVYTFSNDLARKLARARSMSVALSGRNLGLWTNYLGTDPETAFNATSGTDAPNDFQTVAPPSYFILRFNLGY